MKKVNNNLNAQIILTNTIIIPILPAIFKITIKTTVILGLNLLIIISNNNKAYIIKT